MRFQWHAFKRGWLLNCTMHHYNMHPPTLHTTYILNKKQWTEYRKYGKEDTALYNMGHFISTWLFTVSRWPFYNVVGGADAVIVIQKFYIFFGVMGWISLYCLIFFSFLLLFGKWNKKLTPVHTQTHKNSSNFYQVFQFWSRKQRPNLASATEHSIDNNECI